jgi:hypothetical protein
LRESCHEHSICWSLLRVRSSLADRYRSIFPFTEFNPVQSKVFASVRICEPIPLMSEPLNAVHDHQVFESDENLVVACKYSPAYFEVGSAS